MLLNSGTGVQETAQIQEATRQLLLNPKTASYEYLDEASRELVKKTIGFFEKRARPDSKRMTTSGSGMLIS